MKLCSCAQNHALGTRTKFQIEILSINVISGIVCFREIILESSRNVSETTPRAFRLGPNSGPRGSNRSFPETYKSACASAKRGISRSNTGTIWGHRWMTLLAKHIKFIILCHHAKNLIYYLFHKLSQNGHFVSKFTSSMP